jgi:tetratricopeptide (TPR) repeat protein
MSDIFTIIALDFASEEVFQHGVSLVASSTARHHRSRGMLVSMRAFAGLIVMFSVLGAAQETSPDQIFQRAVTEQQRGDYPAAIKDYRAFLQLRPEEIPAKVNLGAALAHTGQFDDAITVYRSALPAVKDKNPILLNIALAYYKKADFENARQQLEILHDALPEDVRIMILLADSDLRLGKPAAALQLLEPVQDKYSQNMDFEYVLGSALIQSGRRRDGFPYIEKVARAGPSADAYQLAGATLLDLNEFELARKDLEEAFRLNPSLPGLYTLVGTARDKTGDVENAEIAFREALQRNPDDFQANLYLGAILYKRRATDEAKGYLDRALRLKPSDSMARYESAMLKSTSGDYAEAAKQLEALVKDDPNWLEPHIELANLYYRLHRPEDGAKERQVVERLTAEQQAQGPAK